MKESKGMRGRGGGEGNEEPSVGMRSEKHKGKERGIEQVTYRAERRPCE